jgi:6-methylsalicylate decarboxylase
MEGTPSARRDFLKTATCTGAFLALSKTGLLASDNEGKRGRIDVHHHMLPPFQPNPIFMPNAKNWNPERSLEVMDKYGTAVAILSFAVPSEYLYNGSEKARTLVRRANDYAAKIANDHPKRFGFFASLPLTQTGACLEEITYAFDTLKCDGVVLMSNTGDKWLGDPLFAPVFEELNRRNSAVFIHPSTPNCCRNLVAGVPDYVVEYDFDTTRTVTSLLYNGTLSRSPNIKWIINHSGAAIPALAGRIKDRVPGDTSNFMSHAEGKNNNIPNGVYHELKRLYYECAHATYPMPIAALRAFAPPTQFLFGTDFPVEAYETTVEQFPNLKLPADVQYGLDRGNAERVWPHFRN